jgi:threonylcarbamoyladenosine tRNA methylthiotransferase MtaB
MSSHPTISFATLGCRTNQAETAQLIAQLSDVCGVVPFPEPADVYVINTCTVTHEADRQSRQVIRRAYRANPEAALIVTGCAVDYHPDELAAMPGVKLIATRNDKERIAAEVAAWYDRTLSAELPPSPEQTGHTRAWLKVSEGCNNRCSFCIVPQTRGPERSIDPAELVVRARALAAAGYQELVLTGTNVGMYGRDRGESLARLLERLIHEVPELPRWRIASIEPIDFPDELVERLADPKVCPQIHLCLQSGSSRVLARMRRRYNADQYRKLVAKLRHVRPDLALTTDVIVGFPGETEEDFAETLAMVEEIGFAGVHQFPFSVREGTHAETLDGRVSPAVIGERMARLSAAAARAKAAWQQGFVGREVEVLTERTPAGSPDRPGHTPHFMKVWVSAAETMPNQRWRARVDRIEDGEAFASLLAPCEGRVSGPGA